MRNLIGAILGLVAGLHAAVLSDFAGTWDLDPARSSNVAASVDSCLAGSNFAVRAMARPRLLKSNAPPERLRISASASEVRVVAGSRTLASPPDGRLAARRTETGKDIRVSHEFKEGKLVQVVEAEHGTRTQTFGLVGDGSSLVVDVRVASPRLERPLVYRLTYASRR